MAKKRAKAASPKKPRKKKSGWDRRPGESSAQHHARCRHYEFMAYDPDNPDVPLD